MAIIICLFLFLAIGGYSAYHKLNNVARREERWELADEIENRSFEPYITTQENTRELRELAISDEIYYSRGLPAQPGAETARELRKRIWDEAKIQPTAEMVMCAILAQDGKVPYDLTWTTYVTTPIEPRLEYWAVEHKFLKWLDNELLEHGMPFRVKFVPRGASLRDAESFDSNQITLRIGKYIWHPDQFSGSATFIKHQYDYNAPFVEYR